jgi:hypothetical protein
MRKSGICYPFCFLFSISFREPDPETMNTGIGEDCVCADSISTQQYLVERVDIR